MIQKYIYIVVYEEQLLQSMNIHHILYMHLIGSYIEINMAKRKQLISLFIKINKNQEFKVEDVLDLRHYLNKLECLVHWCICDNNECTWELYKNLVNASTISIKTKD